MSAGDANRMDGVRLAVLAQRLQGIAKKMANTLLRSGRSGVLNIARDFSCCIVTSDHELVAAADSLPIHVLSGPDLMAAHMKATHPNLKPGDAFLHNSPYHGCSHPADHTILVPVLDGIGKHRFTVVAKAHQADCGNSVPTTYMGNARDVYEEGALIFPSVKVQSNYEHIHDVLRMCQLRIRVPEQWWGDYQAMLGAARIGERELVSLGEEIGWEALDSFASAFLDYSEQRARSEMRKLKKGTAVVTTVHDAIFPVMPKDGLPITAKVTTDPESATIEVDLTDNADCLPFGLNLSESCARTAAMIGVFNSLEASVPKNAGAFRRITVKLRENCVVGIPQHPTSCSVATTNLADRVASAVQMAMAEIDGTRGLAECGAPQAPSMAVVSGKHSTSGKPFVNQLFLGFSGGAAGAAADAWETICHVGNAGMSFLDSIELDELRQPILVKSRAFVLDSEGPGRHTGARSLEVEFGPLGTELEVAYVNDGNVNAARGVLGGSSGYLSNQLIRRADGSTEPAPQVGPILLQAGESVISFTAGGGGYGPAHDRPAADVAADVASGILSGERAAKVYRVATTGVGALDIAKTEALRIATK